MFRLCVRILLRGCLALAVCLWTASTATAHLLPAQQGTVNLVGDAAFVALSVPVSAFSGVDDDGNHLLDAAELQRHLEVLRQQIDERLTVSSGAQQGRTVRIDLMLSPTHDAPVDAAAQLLVLKHVRFATEPGTLHLHTALFGAHGPDQRLTVKATRGSESEAVQLTVERPAFTFFRPGWQSLAESVAMGAGHVLLGADHLLFLLTVWVAGVGWRYWLSVVTGFTVAHSITLCLATLGWVAVSPRWVEPLIAASIVLMALDNLWRTVRPVWQRVGLVFLCGLLHGLGFASAMTDLGLDSRHLVWSLLGFNFGIEVGQAGFLLLLGLAMLALRRGLPGFDGLRFARLLSVLAAVVGSYWVVERLLSDHL